jgi:hypothetical protein
VRQENALIAVAARFAQEVLLMLRLARVNRLHTG